MAENKKEIEVIEPQYGFWEVTVEIATEDAESGKVKKVKELHLCDGSCLQDIEKKVAEEMAGTMWEWKISSAKCSKIAFVY